MEMVSHEEDPELSMVYENFGSDRNAGLRSPSADDKTVNAVEPGVKVRRLVAVGLGLMCVIQAALNISLRLAHFSQYNSLSEERDECKKINFDMETSFRNLTEERNDLKSTIYSIEASFPNLTEERDKLNRTIYDVMANLTEERDKLQRTIFDVEATNKNLTEQRNELKGKLKDFVSLNNSLTEERDECKKISFGMEDRIRNLTKERDALNRTVYDNEIIIKNLTEERDELKRMLNESPLGLPPFRNENKGHPPWLLWTLTTMDPTPVGQSTRSSDNRRYTTVLSAFHQTQQEWVSFGGSFYYMSSTKKTWQDSRNDCLQRGADLITINSREEQNFANQFKKYMWVGLNDIQHDGRWEWVNGTPLTTSLTYWTNGEPNGGTRENCGNIKSFQEILSWNDEDCSTLRFWVCEKKTSP